jgi:NAD(P)-dependent dehydrogenase (short-subunit alcohol dehydrogenase family)
VVLDVTDARTIHALRDRLSAVDVLVNNAGIDYDTDETVLTADLQRVRKIFETNLFGAWGLAQAVTPGMRNRRWGRIVNVSSGAGDGAKSVVWAATLPDDGPTGGFFRDGRRVAW